MKPSLLIVGLGNPGASYANTRHNAGFLGVDVLADAFGEGNWKARDKFTSMCREGRIVTAPALFAKPQTFMNLSGEALRKMLDFYKLNSAQTLVLCDDVDLPLGTLRLKASGGPGTHNGLKSVVEHAGEDFPRLRIGIGPKPETGDLSVWVLSVFSAEERSILEKTLGRLPEIVKNFVLHGTTVNA